MIETWKDVIGYEGRYQISTLGNVKSLLTNKLLKPATLKSGYCIVILTDEKHEKHCYYVHRLVGQMFIPNPLNLPQINHKDRLRSNNFVDNLEWCDAKYNCNYLHPPKTIKHKVKIKPTNRVRKKVEKYNPTVDEIISEIITKLYPKSSQ